MKTKITILWGLLLISIMTYGQARWKAYTTKGIDIPSMTWYEDDSTMISCHQVYRSIINENKFTPISTTNYIYEHHDTIFYIVVDTTLEKKGIYEYRLQCKSNVISETIYGHNLGNVPLPEIYAIEVKDVKDATALRLSWRIRQKSTVTGIDIYRSYYYSKGYHKIATVSREDTVYIDHPDWPGEATFYMFVVKSLFGQSNPTPPVPGIATHEEIPFPPHDLRGTLVNDSIHLTWINLSKNILRYQVFMKSARSNEYYLFKDIDAFKMKGNTLSLPIDTSQEGTLSLYMKARSSGSHQSLPSDTLYFTIRSKKALKPPMGGDIIKDSTEQNIVVWRFRAENEGKVKGYNVYGMKENGIYEKLHPYPIPPWMNYYTDESHKNYKEYQVKVVNDYNVEGIPLIIKNTFYGESTKPQAILMLTNMGKSVKLSWATGYGAPIYLYKKETDRPVKLLKEIKEKKGSFIDKSIATGGTSYFISISKLNAEKNIISNQVQNFKL